MTDHNGNYVYDENSQRLTEDWQYTYLYDNSRNLISRTPKDNTKKSYQYTYSSKNQLIEVKIMDRPLGSMIKQVQYFYDVLGRRIEKRVQDHQNPAKSFARKYVYDGDNIFLEYDGGNNLLAKYTHSPLSPDDILEAEITIAGSGAGLSQSAGKYFYLKDALGSVTDITDSSGNIVQRYNYSSFGGILNIKTASGSDVTSSAPVSTSYTFTGREWDEDVSLYYYRARWYDPSVGRFLQVHPDPGKLLNPASVVNSYIYVQNKPTAFIDPNGRIPWLVIAIISLATTAYENHFRGGNFLEQFAKNFVFNSAVYLIGTWLGGAEFSSAATWQQSAWAATKSLATSSAVRGIAWEAQDRGYASDGAVYALAFLAGVTGEYGGKNLNWTDTRIAIGNLLTYQPVPGGISQVPTSETLRTESPNEH